MFRIFLKIFWDPRSQDPPFYKLWKKVPNLGTFFHGYLCPDPTGDQGDAPHVYVDPGARTPIRASGIFEP